MELIVPVIFLVVVALLAWPLAHAARRDRVAESADEREGDRASHTTQGPAPPRPAPPGRLAVRRGLSSRVGL